MTATRHDRAPGHPAPVSATQTGTSFGLLIYTTGLLLAAILTLISFWVT